MKLLKEILEDVCLLPIIIEAQELVKLVLMP